jgi:hypothetical protein
MPLPAMAYEPVNEMGVMVLFSMLAQQLGFVIEAVQSGFPNCEAKIEVEPGRWQHFRIEFEYESLQFKKHTRSQPVRPHCLLAAQLEELSAAHTGVGTEQAGGAPRKEITPDKRIMDSTFPDDIGTLVSSTSCFFFTFRVPPS